MSSGPTPIRPTGLGPAPIAAASIQVAQTKRGLSSRGRHELKPEIRDSRAIQYSLETSAEAGGQGTTTASSRPARQPDDDAERAGEGEGGPRLDLLG